MQAQAAATNANVASFFKTDECMSNSVVIHVYICFTFFTRFFVNEMKSKSVASCFNLYLF